MKIARATFAVLALALAGGCSSLELAKREWIEVRGPHFELTGEVGEADAVRLLDELEAFRHLVERLLGLETRVKRAPLQIHVLRGDVYAAFGPRGSGGFFTATPRGARIAINAEAGISATGIIYHEYVHYLLSEHGVSYPRWFHEGFAELMRGSRIDGSRAQVGLPLRDRLAQLRGYGPRTLGSLVLPYGSLERSAFDTFYPTAWLFVHYLNLGFGQGFPDRRAQLKECLALLDRGVEAREAFLRAFGVSLQDLDEELGRYLRRDTISILPVDLGGRAPFEPRVRRLDPVEAVASLAELAMLTGNLARARATYREALALGPDDPGLLAGLARSSPRDEAQRELLERALQTGDDDARVHADAAAIWAAPLFAERDRSAGFALSPAERDEAYARARQHFERSLALRPDLPEAHAGLGQLLLQLGEDPVAARDHLEAAARALPGHFPTQLALARAYLATGEAERSHRAALRLLQSAHETRFMSELLDLIAESRAALDTAGP